jgi:uncharacterized protein YkwD
VTDLEARMSAYSAYVTGEPITIREYFRNAEEREVFRYNRWVMQVHNPARTAEASDEELRQTRITNEYRMLMGFTASGRVVPGPAPLDAIDKKTVAGVIDAGTLEGDLPLLRAVRVDDRLVRAARLHSEDMTKRGYFAHEGPANPATGDGPTQPWDRMKKQGYTGGGASENIAQAGDPQTAHDRWCHSSGHHRNILSPWADQGVGFFGSNWTQNYGVGGGDPTEVPPGAEVPATAGNGPRDRR